MGDAGPSSKMGEASARICKEINPKTSGWNRAVSNIKVSYLIFPGTAETPGPPDLARWHQRCKELLDEIGGMGTELHVWNDIVPPWPTPTPSPTVSPALAQQPLRRPALHLQARQFLRAGGCVSQPDGLANFSGYFCQSDNLASRGNSIPGSDSHSIIQRCIPRSVAGGITGQSFSDSRCVDRGFSRHESGPSGLPHALTAFHESPASLMRPTIAENLRQLLCALGTAIRNRVAEGRKSMPAETLATVANQSIADTIYTIDKFGEEAIGEWFGALAIL